MLHVEVSTKLMFRATKKLLIITAPDLECKYASQKLD